MIEQQQPAMFQLPQEMPPVLADPMQVSSSRGGRSDSEWISSGIQQQLTGSSLYWQLQLPWPQQQAISSCTANVTSHSPLLPLFTVPQR